MLESAWIDVSCILGMFAVDILPDTTSHLRHWLDAKLDENAIDSVDHGKTEILTKDFLQSLPYLIQKIQNRKIGEHALFDLDQYSYKDSCRVGFRMSLNLTNSVCACPRYPCAGGRLRNADSCLWSPATHGLDCLSHA